MVIGSPNSPLFTTLICSLLFYNVKNLEIYPWGALSPRVAAAYTPAKASNPQEIKFEAIPKSLTSERDMLLYNPDCFLKRDFVTEPFLSRVRQLFTVEEILAFWTIPVPSPLEYNCYFEDHDG